MPTWENMSVTITYTFGDGGKINFDDCVLKPPRLTFRGVYLPAKNGPPLLSHYGVDFDAGYMVDWWSGVSLFPLGFMAMPRISPLPPYNDSLQVQAAYHEALLPIRNELKRANSDYERLEGYMGVCYGGNAVVDRVKVAYLDGAILGPGGAVSPLVYFHFEYADGRYSILENGGATGPPH
jgi:hypothetical protein